MGVALMTRVWGLAPLLFQLAPLAHAETVLLVGDDHAQVVVVHALLDQGMGPDDHLGLPRGDAFHGRLMVRRLHGAGDQDHLDAVG